jgi:poly-gamma-glutamate capsule biosynthesis protein CapA/YwtB (metallophosphatase superfamily)
MQDDADLVGGMREQITFPSLKLFLAGDVMTGRGDDQILPHPIDPEIFESYSVTAFDYLRMAERRHGVIPQPVSFDYIWGDGLTEFSRQQPDIRLINLETAITRSNAAADKGINYRMSPENVEVLSAARIQTCVLANNHVLDWASRVF